MKFKNMMMVGMILLAILTVGAVSASQDVNETLMDDASDVDVTSEAEDIEEVSSEETQDSLEQFEINDTTFRSNAEWQMHKYNTENHVADVWWIEEDDTSDVMTDDITLKVTNAAGNSKVYKKSYADSEEFYDFYYRDEMNQVLRKVSWNLGELDFINETGHYKLDISYKDTNILNDWNLQVTEFIYGTINPNRGDFDINCVGYKWDGIYVDNPFDVYHVFYDRNKFHLRVWVGDDNETTFEGRQTSNPVVWNLRDLGITSPGNHVIHTEVFDSQNKSVENFTWTIPVIDAVDDYRIKWNYLGTHDYDCEKPVIYFYCPSWMDENDNVTVKVDNREVFTTQALPGQWLGFTLKNLSIEKNGAHLIKVNDMDEIGNVREVYLWIDHFIDSYVDGDGIEFTYGSSGSTYLSLNGVIDIIAEVIGHPEAVILIDNNKVTVSNLEAGSYKLNVTTVTNNSYVPKSVIIPVTVNKVSGAITASGVTLTYGDSKTVLITLKDFNRDAKNNVEIVLNKVKYTKVANSKGQVSFMIPNTLAPGSYKAVITYVGSGNFAKTTKTVNVKVNRAPSKIIAKKKTFKIKAKNKKYSITLKSGKKLIKKAVVSLKFGKYLFRAKTGGNGVATFSITKITKPKYYKATVAFAGNKYFSKSSKKVVLIFKRR